MDEIGERLLAVTVGTQTDSRGEGQLGNDGMEAFRGMLTVTVDTATSMRFCRLAEESDQLIPGIHDDITLHQIAPKLPWRDLHNLSLVSHGWQQAIRSHQVHDARIRSQSTELFAVIFTKGHPEEFTLFSVRDRYYYKIPEVPSPHLEGQAFRWTTLDGKIYALGGLKDIEGQCWPSRDVYVLDLAGQREWKKCASMNEGRYDCGHGVLDGKIYVFGGLYCDVTDCDGSDCDRCEVYDPKENSWSRISPNAVCRHEPRVAAVGEELFLYSGIWRDAEQSFWEVYHPKKDEWRKVYPFPEGRRKVYPFSQNREGWVFFAQGRFHLMTEVDIHVYEHEKNTWSHLHSFSLDAIAGLNDDWSYDPEDIIALNDELLLAAGFIRSRGFGSNEKKISWETENVSFYTDKEFNFMCTVEL